VPANTCRIVVGRLMEVDVAAGYRTVQDVDDMIDAIHAVLTTVPTSQRVVIAADWSACRLFAPEVSERAVRMLLRSNPRMLRSAILHEATQPTSILQAFRLVSEADAPFRRVFTERAAMCAWLSEVLSPDESARLHAFLMRR
jgi:hypothetical protein